MKTRVTNVAGKILYGVIFIVLLPLLLWWWAWQTAPVVSLPVIQSAPGGSVLIGVGGALLVSGMYALWVFGDGLPMNAFPPVNYVQKGVYQWFAHPIYLGFCLVCWGASVLWGSGSGFWLVSPVVAAGCAALVWGYENPDLKKRFPGRLLNFRLGIPPDEPAGPAEYHRLAVYTGILLPWWALQAIFEWASWGENVQEPVFLLPDNFAPAFLGNMAAVGAGIWVWLSPLIARTREDLRRFYVGGLVGGGTLLYLALVIPGLAFPHWISSNHPESDFILHALFSTSLLWIWLATEIYLRAIPRLQALFFSIASILTLGVVANSTDPLLHAATGGLALALALYYPIIWEFLREQAEAVANSWKEWRWGMVRVINHGFYVGAAAFLGVIMSSLLAGPAYVTGTVVSGVIGVICAGIWGQLIEGSDKLKRPFGYYGSVAGIAVAVIVLHLMGINIWVIVAVFSVFMPWAQAIGRLRCLVNGCCHGAPANERLGVHYYHPRSRVCYLSDLKGKALHPTQLYALLWLGLVGGFQLRMWFTGVAPSLLFGLYLILTGLGRFVEEAYRGERQTPFFAGLRLYQWAAAISVLAGIFISTVPSVLPPLTPGLNWTAVAWSLFMWVFVQFLMGVDFPESQKRFSRLA